jgi:hypothetical protein
LAQVHRLAGERVGGVDQHRDRQVLQALLAEGGADAIHDQAIVAQCEGFAKALAPRGHHRRKGELQPGLAAAHARDLARPQGLGQAQALLSRVTGCDQRAEHGACAAAHDQIRAQASMLQHFEDPERGDAAHTAAAEHHGQAGRRRGRLHGASVHASLQPRRAAPRLALSRASSSVRYTAPLLWSRLGEPARPAGAA